MLEADLGEPHARQHQRGRLVEPAVLDDRQRDVLTHGHRVEERRALKGHADVLQNLVALGAARGVDVAAADEDAAARRRQQADDAAQERALPRAAAAEHDEDLAGVERERDPVEDELVAVAGGDVVDDQERGAGVPSGASRLRVRAHPV